MCLYLCSLLVGAINKSVAFAFDYAAFASVRSASLCDPSARRRLASRHAESPLVAHALPVGRAKSASLTGPLSGSYCDMWPQSDGRQPRARATVRRARLRRRAATCRRFQHPLFGPAALANGTALGQYTLSSPLPSPREAHPSHPALRGRGWFSSSLIDQPKRELYRRYVVRKERLTLDGFLVQALKPAAADSVVGAKRAGRRGAARIPKGLRSRSLVATLARERSRQGCRYKPVRAEKEIVTMAVFVLDRQGRPLMPAQTACPPCYWRALGHGCIGCAVRYPAD